MNAIEFKKAVANKAAKVVVEEMFKGAAKIHAYGLDGKHIATTVHRSRVNAPIHVEGHGHGLLISEGFWNDKHARDYIRQNRGRCHFFKIVFTAGDVDVIKKQYAV